MGTQDGPIPGLNLKDRLIPWLVVARSPATPPDCETECQADENAEHAAPDGVFLNGGFDRAEHGIVEEIRADSACCGSSTCRRPA